MYNGFGAQDTIRIKNELETKGFRAAGFFRNRQPGFKKRRGTCGNFGAFVHIGRKDDDFCTNSANLAGRGSNLAFMQYWLGLKLVPFSCYIG